MDMQPVYNFDKFVVLLAMKVQIYNGKNGDRISLLEIANTKFGEVKRLLDEGIYQYNTKDFNGK